MWRVVWRVVRVVWRDAARGVDGRGACGVVWMVCVVSHNGCACSRNHTLERSSRDAHCKARATSSQPTTVLVIGLKQGDILGRTRPHPTHTALTPNISTHPHHDHRQPPSPKESVSPPPTHRRGKFDTIASSTSPKPTMRFIS